MSSMSDKECFDVDMDTVELIRPQLMEDIHGQEEVIEDEIEVNMERHLNDK